MLAGSLITWYDHAVSLLGQHEVRLSYAYSTDTSSLHILQAQEEPHFCSQCRGGDLREFTQSMGSAFLLPGCVPGSFCFSGSSSICGSTGHKLQI